MPGPEPRWKDPVTLVDNWRHEPDEVASTYSLFERVGRGVGQRSLTKRLPPSYWLLCSDQS